MRRQQVTLKFSYTLTETNLIFCLSISLSISLSLFKYKLQKDLNYRMFLKYFSIKRMTFWTSFIKHNVKHFSRACRIRDTSRSRYIIASLFLLGRSRGIRFAAFSDRGERLTFNTRRIESRRLQRESVCGGSRTRDLAIDPSSVNRVSGVDHPWRDVHLPPAFLLSYSTSRAKRHKDRDVDAFQAPWIAARRVYLLPFIKYLFTRFQIITHM